VSSPLKKLVNNDETAAFIRKIQASFDAQNAKRPMLVTFEEPAPICPVCSNMGVVSHRAPLGHRDFGKLFPCPHENCPTRYDWQKRRAYKLMNETEIPAAYVDLNLEAFLDMNPSVLKGKYLAWGLCAAMVFYHGATEGFTLRHAAELTGKLNPEKYNDTLPRRSLVLSGTYGLGKTTLACGTVKALAAANIPVLYIRLDDLFTDIQHRYGEIGSDEDRAEQRLRRVSLMPVLVLDECNVSTISDDKQRIFESIVRYRAGNRLPTLYTTNLTHEEFRRTWGQRIADPLFADAHYIELQGERLRANANVAQEW